MLFVSLSLSRRRPVLGIYSPGFRNEGNSVEASGIMKRLLLFAGVAAILVLTFEVAEASPESNSWSGSDETPPPQKQKRSPQRGPPDCLPMSANGMEQSQSPNGKPPCGPPPDMESTTSGDVDSQVRGKRFARGPQPDGEQGGPGDRGMGGGIGGVGEAMANGAQAMGKAMGEMANTAGNMMGGAMRGMG